jgi:flap endonuclease-1
MGIKGLNDIIKKYYPNILKNEIKLSNYMYQKIAIDTTLYMFKYKAILGDKWLNGFFNLIICLRKNNIHCVFIEDGKAPIEKSNERKKRAQQKEKLENKIYDIENALNKYYNTNEIDEILLKMCESENNEKIKNLFRDDVSSIRTQSFNIKICEAYLRKIQSQNVKINENDFILVRDLFKYLGIPYFKSEKEAETMCCYLAYHGYVDAVLSEDTDVLAYKTGKFLTKINTSNETCIEIDFQELIQNLELEKDTFVDLCIMCGNDYNDNIKGIGPDKSYKLLKEYKNIEEIEKIIDIKTKSPKFDTTVLNYKKTRELFKVPEDFVFKIPYCDKPNFEKLEEFLFVNNIRIDINNLKNFFKMPEINIEE